MNPYDLRYYGSCRFYPPPGAGEGRVRGSFGNLGLVSEDSPHPGPSPAPGGGKSEKLLETFSPTIGGT
jgi:hypothetical protein